MSIGSNGDEDGDKLTNVATNMTDVSLLIK